MQLSISPSLLIAATLLALLALLLFGRCSYPHVNGRQPTPPPTVYGRVAHIDSLTVATTASPATLHLTLEFGNQLKRAITLSTAEGEVRFEGQSWAFSASSQISGVVLRHRAMQQARVAVRLVPAPTDLPELRVAIATGSTGGNSLRLKLEATYFDPQNSAAPQQATTATYLSGLKPGQVTPRP